MSVQFVHLRVHSEYSLSDGLLRPEALPGQAAALGMPAVALSDLGNLFAMARFHRAAVACGVKPIIGIDFWVCPPRQERLSRCTLLARNELGYRQLVSLCSRAWLEGTRGAAGEARNGALRWEWLEDSCNGLIALCGGMRGEIGRALIEGHQAQARGALDRWQQRFPGNFYLELCRTGRAGEDAHVALNSTLAVQAGCPLVASNEVRFLKREDYGAHETRVCIAESTTLNDPDRLSRHSESQYLRSPQEMAELFADVPEALANSVEIARRCNVWLPTGPHLPSYPRLVPTQQSGQLLAKMAHRGLRLRLGHAPNEAQQQRLSEELGIIEQLGYADYFLIVMDFTRWARKQGIPVGPGRGSGASSLVAYGLRITDIDPLPHQLLFERFLNTERVSLPDFDIDFCQERRDEVIQYVRDRYGENAAVHVITFNRMAARAVVRDVARAQGKPYGIGDRLARLIPPAPNMTLAVALGGQQAITASKSGRAPPVNQELNQLLEQDAELRAVWDTALVLEGLTRNISRHAGGVVIADANQMSAMPLCREQRDQAVMTQLDKDDLEQLGFLKFDFLSLRTLTVLEYATQAINAERTARNEPPLGEPPLDDPAVYQLLGQGETTAVFQLESRGMRQLIRKLRPREFNDLVVLLALYRPGPLGVGMHETYVERRNGSVSFDYRPPELREILEETQGVITYQEQVMRIARQLAGYSLGEADLLRRAIGKKKSEELAAQRGKFTQGAVARGHDPKIITQLFDQIEQFGGYGFNKSHSVAYALLAYHTAWYKTKHPVHFMAAEMSVDMENHERLHLLSMECRRLGIRLLPPDVNHSAARFHATSSGGIRFGLGAIKNFGRGAAAQLIATRQSTGPFTDLFDFCQRIDLTMFSAQSLEALIDAGACDVLGDGERPMLRAALQHAIGSAERHQRNAAVGMTDLFGGGAVPGDGEPPDVYRDFRTATTDPAHTLAAEANALGQHLSANPVTLYRQELSQLRPQPLDSLERNHPAWIVGTVVDVRLQGWRKRAFLQLDDGRASVELIIDSELYHQHRQDLLEKHQVLLVRGNLAAGGSVRAEALLSIEQWRAQRVHALRLQLCAADCADSSLDQLEQLLRNGGAKGSCALLINYSDADHAVDLRMSEDWQLDLSDALLFGLRQHLGAERVEMLFSTPVYTKSILNSAISPEHAP